MSHAAAAFFDMDKTVVLGNTARLYVEDMHERGEVSTRQMLGLSTVLIRYKLSLVDMNRVMADAVTKIAGMPVSHLSERCESLFAHRIAPLISEAAREAIEGHRRMGHKVVLLTAQTPYMTALVSEALGLGDEFLCTRLTVKDGHFTGQIDGPACYGAGKCHWAQRFAEQHDLSLAESYFYTDSYSDLPMLEAVGHRRVVNPDPRLRLHATLRRWPVLWFNR